MKKMIEDLRSIVALKLLSIAMDVAPPRERRDLAKLVRAHIMQELPEALRDHELRRG